jgi:hypothetical protein
MAQDINMPMDPNTMDPNMMMPEEGEASVVPGEEEMASPAQIDQLKEMMSKVEEKYRQMNAESFAGANQTESLRKDLVLDVFKMLKELGVNLSDPASVREYLDQMEQANPDLYDLFVSSFEGLLGQEEGAAGIPQGAQEALSGAAPISEEQSGALPQGMPPMPGAPSGPSNPGLSGMLPTAGGISGQFSNLAK